MSIYSPDNQPTPPPPPPYQAAQYAPETYPGKGLGLAAMIVSLAGLVFPTALIGAILGHVAYSQSMKAGFKNNFALVGIIAGWVLTALSTLVLLVWILLVFAVSSAGAGYDMY